MYSEHLNFFLKTQRLVNCELVVPKVKNRVIFRIYKGVQRSVLLNACAWVTCFTLRYDTAQTQFHPKFPLPGQFCIFWHQHVNPNLSFKTSFHKILSDLSYITLMFCKSLWATFLIKQAWLH